MFSFSQIGHNERVSETDQRHQEAVREALAILDQLDDEELAQRCMTVLHDRSGGALSASVYRIVESRMWLVAQAGYRNVIDGIAAGHGLIGRALATQKTQWASHGSGHPHWVEGEPGLVSQVSVPRRGFMVNLESAVPICGALVRPFEELAAALTDRLVHTPRPILEGIGNVPRALVSMVGLGTPEQIAEYTLRLISRVAGLSAGRLVLTHPGPEPIDVSLRSGTGLRPPSHDDVLRHTASFHGYSTAVAPSDDGPDLLIVPVSSRGTPVGGIVGSAERIDDSGVWTPSVAAIAAHAIACLDRVSLERSLSDTLAARGDFVASISHELRTPLTAILGYSELITSGDAGGPEEIAEFAGAIRDGARHLLELVSDLLDVARSEAGRLMIDISPRVALEPIVDDVLTFVAPQAAERRVALVEDVERNLTVRGDPTRVRQVLVNLVSNAVKFTEDGTVRVFGRAHAGSVVLTVKDDGRGLTRQELATLFQPFVAGIGTSPGTGLGLVISRRLAEAMGGSLELDSPGLGEGAVATVVLPTAGHRLS